jgi:hypothetical protein
VLFGELLPAPVVPLAVTAVPLLFWEVVCAGEFESTVVFSAALATSSAHVGFR